MAWHNFLKKIGCKNYARLQELPFANLLLVVIKNYSQLKQFQVYNPFMG